MILEVSSIHIDWTQIELYTRLFITHFTLGGVMLPWYQPVSHTHTHQSEGVCAASTQTHTHTAAGGADRN